MNLPHSFLRGNRGNRGNKPASQGFRLFPHPCTSGEQGEQNATRVPSVPSLKNAGERREPLLDKAVPCVPSVPPRNDGGKRDF